MSEDLVHPHADLVSAISGELNNGQFEVPLLSHIASEVLSTTLDDKSNAQRLADLIEKDQSMAMYILRVVNSPDFRGSQEIIALRQAIARLGMERIREIALTITLRGSVFKPSQFDDLVEETWQLGLRGALWAKEVARSARQNVEIAYLRGLLHNMGTPILVNRAVELVPDVSGQEMQTVIDTLAQQAGALLVKEWHLPDVVATCITHTGDFAAAGTDADAVAINDAAYCVALQHAQNQLDAQAILSHGAIQHLNFYPDTIEQLLEVAERIDQTIEGMK